MTSSTGRLRVVASTPITEDLIAEIVRAEPRIDFVRDQKLLPPQRFPGDHSGDPTFTRTAAEQSAFDALVDSDFDSDLDSDFDSLFDSDLLLSDVAPDVFADAGVVELSLLRA